MLRFHLDENVDVAIGSGLRLRGGDVTITNELGMKGAKDDEQIAFALRELRMIITHDDLLALHAQGTPHAGIAYCAVRARTIGQIILNLMASLAVSTHQA